MFIGPLLKISIHALTRRAAQREVDDLRKAGLFQSTLSRGERLWGRYCGDQSLKFQSTLSRGERHQLFSPSPERS